MWRLLIALRLRFHMICLIISSFGCSVNLLVLGYLLRAWLNEEALLGKHCFLLCFPVGAKLGNICFGSKILCQGNNNVFDSRQKQIFVSEHLTGKPARLGNICLRNNAS